MKKTVLFLSVLFLISLVKLTSCSGSLLSDANNPEQDRFWPDRVNEVPSGFIALNDTRQKTEGILTAFFWSTNFVVQCSEIVTIFQTDVKNNEFIVMYNDEFYVNNDKFWEVYEYALTIYSQLNRIYDIGDEINIRGLMNGVRVIFQIEIHAVSLISNEDENPSIYEIKFNIEPQVQDNRILEFFSYIETTNGMIYNQFEFIDSGTVRIEVDDNATIETLVLSNPEMSLQMSSMQNSIRRVRIN